MKPNWGTAIAIFYGSFMAILLFFVLRSTTVPHSLVMDNYYEQDLHYQDHYEKIVNAAGLGTGFYINYEESTERLSIHFPPEMHIEKGSVVLFKPADSRQDLKQAITSDTAKVVMVPTKDLSRGHWKVKVDWEADGKAYYREKEIYL